MYSSVKENRPKANSFGAQTFLSRAARNCNVKTAFSGNGGAKGVRLREDDFQIATLLTIYLRALNQNTMPL